AYSAERNGVAVQARNDVIIRGEIPRFARNDNVRFGRESGGGRAAAAPPPFHPHSYSHSPLSFRMERSEMRNLMLYANMLQNCAICHTPLQRRGISYIAKSRIFAAIIHQNFFYNEKTIPNCVDGSMFSGNYCSEQR
ncbi:MAG: hypothetical protein FWG84_05170, partial [Bacteroidales bacterium]|nr:hypothetical protein [Bacteroidales bacterium]